MGAAMHRSGQLAALASDFDLVIVDCPPRHGDVQRSALMVADVALLPCGPSAADAWALSAAIDVVSEARALRDELRACIVITRKQGRTALAKQARKVLASSGLEVLGAELSQRIAYQEAIAVGRGVTSHAPRDAASLEVFNLLDELRRFGHGEEGSRDLVAQAEAG
jgi:chromosome partitioning protein